MYLILKSGRLYGLPLLVSILISFLAEIISSHPGMSSAPYNRFFHSRFDSVHSEERIMLFSSIIFIYLFIPVVLFFYYIVFRKSRSLQNFFLFFASLVFYGWGEPKYVFLLLASIFINWVLGLLIDRYRSRLHLCRFLLILDVAFNLSILFVFKYLSFTCELIKELLGLQISIPSIVLPIGISFFTFQAMSYVIDVYRGKGQAQKSPFLVGLYISLFPQLIAGPIVRYETVAREIQERVTTVNDFFNGFSRFIIGLAKKVLLANCFSVLADAGFQALTDNGSLSVGFSWLSAVAYTMQIYYDFSGYSDMAIGLGQMFGFHFLENFNYPYISSSITEFWRRWHISLGTWFRDYLYFPLGGSRVSKKRTVLNLLFVWLLTGLWHGANYTFVVWGLMYFVLIAIEKLTGLPKKESKSLLVLRRMYTLLFVILGWVIFRSDSLSMASVFIASMFRFCGNSLSDGLFLGYLSQYWLPLSVGILFCLPVGRLLQQKARTNPYLDWLYSFSLLILFILSVANISSSSYNPFIYFNF